MSTCTSARQRRIAQSCPPRSPAGPHAFAISPFGPPFAFSPCPLASPPLVMPRLSSHLVVQRGPGLVITSYLLREVVIQLCLSISPLRWWGHFAPVSLFVFCELPFNRNLQCFFLYHSVRAFSLSMHQSYLRLSVSLLACSLY